MLRLQARTGAASTYPVNPDWFTKKSREANLQMALSNELEGLLQPRLGLAAKLKLDIPTF